MNKYKNKSKSKQPIIVEQPKMTPEPMPQQTKAAQSIIPQPIRDIPSPTLGTVTVPSHEDIAKRAYQIYIQRGCPQGQSEEIWQQAERELRTRGKTTPLSM